MFPSMEIFLMRVPSELAAGDGQLLLGGVAMPSPVGSPERFRQGGLGGGRRCARRGSRHPGTRLNLQTELCPVPDSPAGGSAGLRASLPKPCPASSVHAREGAGCGKNSPPLMWERSLGGSEDPILYPSSLRLASFAEFSWGTSIPSCSGPSLDQNSPPGFPVTHVSLDQGGTQHRESGWLTRR